MTVLFEIAKKQNDKLYANKKKFYGVCWFKGGTLSKNVLTAAIIFFYYVDTLMYKLY